MLTFNVSPYNDDYAESKDFYRVLFKPSVAVQARELTTLQSILQEQIKYFGDSIYQHGSMVVPGQIAIDPNTGYVCLQPTYGTFESVPIPINLGFFVGQIVSGQTSGLLAQVVGTQAATGTFPNTIFVKYMNVGTNGATAFLGNELLTLKGSPTVLAQTTSTPTGLAISAQIDAGVYYVNGIFTRVEPQYLILSAFDNVVTTRVGLQIVESIVTSFDDPSLLDNAQGNPNYAAPGADRYKVALILTQQPITSPDDTNFIELVRLVDSVIQKLTNTDAYSIIETELAQRMSDANGDFVVESFSVDVRESLDTSFVTSGTAQGGIAATSTPTPATITLATAASVTNGAYVNMSLYISNGTGAGQTFTITAYNGSTKVATLDDDYLQFQVADTTSVYTITNPAEVNRGIYPPPPFGIGDSTQLAVGMEPGRGYVNGYLVDTLVTNYVNIPKSRTFSQATGAVFPANIGNYLIVGDLHNLPLSTGDDYIEITLTNVPMCGVTVLDYGLGFGGFTNINTFDSSKAIGTAKVATMEWFYGVSERDLPTALFKLYLFDLQLFPGASLSDVVGYYAATGLGDPIFDVYGVVCGAYNVVNVTNAGAGFTHGSSILGPGGVDASACEYYDPVNGLLAFAPILTSGFDIYPPITTNGQATGGGYLDVVDFPVPTLVNGDGSGALSAAKTATATITGRQFLFDAADSLLLFPLPQPVIKTLTDSSSDFNTTYRARQMMVAPGTPGGGTTNYVFTTTSTAPFVPFNTVDYLAVITNAVSGGGNSLDAVGAVVRLTSGMVTFSGSPENTTLTISIASGPGSTTMATGNVMKLMTTIQRSNASPKTKSLVNGTLAVPTPAAVISLSKADIFAITAIYDSGNPSVAVDTSNLGQYVSIMNRYYVDNGQRDYFYDIGAVTLIPGAPAPAGQLYIQFTYFQHAGHGDYFCTDSYTNQVDFTEIPTYLASNGIYYPLRDCLDFRPRRSDSADNFSGSGSSFSLPLKPNDTITADYQYYLSRIDKIYLTQYGAFESITGTPALAPVPPPDPSDGMMLYTITLNPYTLSSSDVTTTGARNRRYTMQDIGKLEERISNLEYYTLLNQLELQTQAMQITDILTGLTRFKNGYIVDTFTGHNVGNVFDSDYKCSVDPTTGTLRPPFIQQSNDLILNTSVSTGYIERAGLVMMLYTHTPLVSQPYATSSLNVNPFAIFVWYGDVALDPAGDTWKDTVQRPVITVTNDSALDGIQYLVNWEGCMWDDWQVGWVGIPVSTSNTVSLVQSVGTWTKPNTGAGNQILSINGQRFSPTGPQFNSPTIQSSDITANTITTTQQIGQVRIGTQTSSTAPTSEVVNSSVIDISVIPYLRSRRIKMVGRHFKPSSRLYPFLDGVNISAYCRPYLDPAITPTLSGTGWTTQNITWGGDYDPQTNTTSGDTGETATYAVGALNAPLMTDAFGTVTLFVELPCTSSVKFKSGTRLFRLTDDGLNGASATTYGNAEYTGSGILSQYQDSITSPVTPETLSQIITDTQIASSVLTTAQDTTAPVWLDPLAQSFTIQQPGGAFISKIDLYFAKADPVAPITLQIRNMVNGYPGQTIVPFSEKTLYPGNPGLSILDSTGTFPSGAQALTAGVINVSSDVSLATTFEFDAPVYLSDGVQYCFVLITNSLQYQVYSATLGGSVIGSVNMVSKTPFLGNVFKSQNATTWVSDTLTSLRFTLYRAVFDPASTGEAYFTNSSVQPDILGSLPFRTCSFSGLANTVRVNHPNHGMPQGAFVNSVVTISNVPAGTYNGLTNAQLTGTFSIQNVDLDSYTITVSGAGATSSGQVGPDGVMATKNCQYDSICPVVNQLTPPGCAASWSIKTTTGKSPHNNVFTTQEPYQKDLSYTTVPVNVTTDFTAPRMIASDINEITSLAVGMGSIFDRKSYVQQAVLTTTQDNLTPVIDTRRTSVILANTRLDDPTFPNFTLDHMDDVYSITSSSDDPISLTCEVLLEVSGVTGGQFVASQTITGIVTGVTATVVSWDGGTLVVSGIVPAGPYTNFQTGELISNSGTTSRAYTILGAPTGSAPVVGTIQALSVTNTITDVHGVYDFGKFTPGYDLTIVGCPSDVFGFGDPVTILGSTNGGNSLVVAADALFTTATNQAGVTLTQYGRFVAESGPTNCTTAARYITRQLSLSNQANSLQVLFNVNLPAGAFVDVYYRVIKANGSSDLAGIIWEQMDLDPTVDSSPSDSPTQFKPYSYTANNIGSYSVFTVKIVMRGGNSSLPPRIQSFQAIALAT